MSRTTKSITKQKEVTETVLESANCDRCGKDLEIVDGKPICISATLGHNGWGAESHESVEYKDFCSLSCASSYIKKYCDSPRDSTAYFEISAEGKAVLDLVKDDNTDYKGMYHTLLKRLRELAK